MKVSINGHFFKEVADIQQTQTRGLEETSKPITPEDVQAVVNLAFTLKDVLKALYLVVKSWFKK